MKRRMNVNDFDEAFESSTAKRKYEDRMAQKFSTFQINDNSIDDSQQTNCDKFSITELADTDTDWDDFDMSGSSNPTCPIIEEPDLRSSLVRTSTEDDEKDDTTTDQNVVLSSELKAYIDSCKEKGLEFMSRPSGKELVPYTQPRLFDFLIADKMNNRIEDVSHWEDEFSKVEDGESDGLPTPATSISHSPLVSSDDDVEDMEIS